MKAIYCELCGSITSPGNGDRKPRNCDCGTHRCWWEDGFTGQFRVEYLMGHPLTRETGAPPHDPEVWVLGISNSFLHHKGRGTPSADEVQKMLEATPSNYIFRQTMSNIIRIRPGQSSDTAWAKFEGPLPKNFDEELRIRTAVDGAIVEERKRVLHYLHSHPVPFNDGLAKELEDLAHLKEEFNTSRDGGVYD